MAMHSKQLTQKARFYQRGKQREIPDILAN